MSIKCLPLEARRQIITDNILHCTYEQLAELCHCTTQTIYRTISDWKKEGGFEELLLNEFIEVYPIVKTENPDKALDKIVYLLGKGITRKAEIKSEHHEEITSKHVEELNVTMRNYEDEVQAVVSRYIREDSPP
jgi:hypothetical protein